MADPTPEALRAARYWLTSVRDSAAMGEIVRGHVEVLLAGLDGPTPEARRTAAKLPTYDECEAACDRGRGTTLQRFIYDNEPVGEERARYFRERLAAVLLEALTAAATPLSGDEA